VRLLVRAGRATLVEQSIPDDTTELHVRFVVPLWLRWAGIGVIVKTTGGTSPIVVSVTM
jgi:hypothetical protein